MKKNIRVYYTHSKRTYGSEKEQNEYLFLKSIYTKTICPNKDIGELKSIQPYLKIVEWSDLIVFSEYMNFIGKKILNNELYIRNIAHVTRYSDIKKKYE